MLALYRAGQDAFTADDLRVVEAIGAGLGIAIESAGKPNRLRKNSIRDSVLKGREP